MAIIWKQVVALSIFVSLSFAALMLTTAINYKPISSFSPPCSKSRQENCVTHSPPVNEPQRPCNPSDHCRGAQSLMGTESMSKDQVSAATKQVSALHIVVPLMLFALMMTTVLCGSGSLAATVNCESIGNITPPCIKNCQENCVTHSPPVKEQQCPFSPLDHCHGDESLTAIESMSRSQVSLPQKTSCCSQYFCASLPTVLCESGSQTTPVNSNPISSFSAPCSKSRQENCVTHSPPVNEPQRPCNPADHYCGGQSLMRTESVGNAQVPAATKQVIALLIIVPLMLFALMMTTVLCGRGSLAAAVNCESISNITPSCIKNCQ